MSNAVSRIEEHAAPSTEGRRPIGQILSLTCRRPVAPRHIRTAQAGSSTSQLHRVAPRPIISITSRLAGVGRSFRLPSTAG